MTAGGLYRSGFDKMKYQLPDKEITDISEFITEFRKIHKVYQYNEIHSDNTILAIRFMKGCLQWTII